MTVHLAARPLAQDAAIDCDSHVGILPSGAKQPRAFWPAHDLQPLRRFSPIIAPCFAAAAQLKRFDIADAADRAEQSRPTGGSWRHLPSAVEVVE